MDQKLANAHLIADHLKALSRLLSDPTVLSEETKVIMGIGAPFTVEALTKFADRLEASAPFVPLTDEETSKLVLELTDEVSDYSRRECAELIYGDWTPAHWRMELDDREEQRLEDEREEVGE